MEESFFQLSGEGILKAVRVKHRLLGKIRKACLASILKKLVEMMKETISTNTHGKIELFRISLSQKIVTS